MTPIGSALGLIGLSDAPRVYIPNVSHGQTTCVVHQSRLHMETVSVGVGTDAGCSDMVLIDNLVNPLACSQF